MKIIVMGLILAAIIGIVFIQDKPELMQKISMGEAKRRKSPYNRAEAEQFVKQLDELGYFKYADKTDIDSLKENMIVSYDIDGGLTSIWDDETGIPKDYRFYPCDGEDVYEQGGIIDLLKKIKPSFDKINFKCEITNHFEEWDDKNEWLNHRITINGTEYIIFENETKIGWAEAPRRIAEILNIELSKQGKDEKIYLASGGNEGWLIFLTEDIYKYIYSVYKDPREKPLDLKEWAKMAE
jgi:hypothetical protein